MLPGTLLDTAKRSFDDVQPVLPANIDGADIYWHQLYPDWSFVENQQ
jgi:hypothetical protein